MPGVPEVGKPVRGSINVDDDTSRKSGRTTVWPILALNCIESSLMKVKANAG